MKKLILSSLLIVAAFFSTAVAQTTPLIDRALLFDAPEYSGAQISPDGKYISFMKPFNGTQNVFVKTIEEPFEKARPLTNRSDRPIPGYFWSRDGKFILFVQDQGGDENFNVYAVSVSDKPAAGKDVPDARALTSGKIRAQLYSVPKSDPDSIYVGLNDRDSAWHDVYKISISTGKRTLITENKDRYVGVIFDTADKLRAALRSTQAGDTEVLRINADGTTTKIYECGALESCAPLAFHKDNRRIYMSSNKGNVDLAELILVDIETGKSEKVESDPLGRVDFGGANFSALTNELLATAYEDDKLRIYFKDKNLETDYNFIKKQLGDRSINFVSNTSDESKFIVSVTSDIDPGSTWVFDRKTRKLTLLYNLREKLNREHLSEMKPIRYKSSDGLEIPAYLTLPKGLEAKNLPLIVMPHGGPWARDSWGFDPYAQMLANRGYAVLQMNFRGSTGFGKKFLDAGNNEWGQKMQDDITWGVKHLVAQGIVDSKRVGILGGSYGGYAALAGVAFTPDVYSAAVAIVPPSNLQTLLESIPPYWESFRNIFYKRMGNPNTPEGLAQMKRQSPLFSADKIRTPLMVVQGANDPRVVQRESDQIVIALRDRGFPVEYILAPDEGHGFARPVNNMAMLAAAEKFLAKHLGGRFQESMPDDVRTRLAEITVDPKTVTIKAPVDMTAAATVDLTGKWNVTLTAGPQSIEVTLDIRQEGGNLSGTLTSMIGSGSVTGGKVSGENVQMEILLEAQGQKMPVKFEGKAGANQIEGTLGGSGIPPLPLKGTRGK
jgi:dipeptidyl aminopeptidase/acylaminoacyl peptidase